MSTSSTPAAPAATPIKPYLLRAWHEWCTDNGRTPYMAVFVDQYVDVPREFVKDQAIVLNVGYVATDGLKIDNDYVHFKARFSGQVREIWVPVSHVTAIFARETQEGMEFARPTPEELAALARPGASTSATASAPPAAQKPAAPKPAGGLRIVK
ncbi:ClpXP protease specificity-enhancing factor [Amphibiibacter pelophylacis]|uniref:ClpXP protease specificity-enhancing factor n=1 Tax=Amphibiibacter pelophylacis TaxID=1799477 RepID=A0ACC6NYG0_9BURK